ncbi:DUF4113 domain-containing protein [Pseudomonas sp. HLS-6 TE3448]|jgi:hypothetical protein
MDDLEGKMKAGQPLWRQAMDALRRYNEANGVLFPEEVERREVPCSVIGRVTVKIGVILPGDRPWQMKREMLSQGDTTSWK